MANAVDFYIIKHSTLADVIVTKFSFSCAWPRDSVFVMLFRLLCNYIIMFSHVTSDVCLNAGVVMFFVQMV